MDSKEGRMNKTSALFAAMLIMVAPLAALRRRKAVPVTDQIDRGEDQRLGAVQECAPSLIAPCHSSELPGTL